MPLAPKSFGNNGGRREFRRRHDHARGTASQRGPYCSFEWREVIRPRIALRDMYTCQLCGRIVGIKPNDWHCDHIEDRPVGAPLNVEQWDRDSNLRTLCVACHNAKSGGKNAIHAGGA